LLSFKQKIFYIFDIARTPIVQRLRWITTPPPILQTCNSIQSFCQSPIQSLESHHMGLFHDLLRKNATPLKHCSHLYDKLSSGNFCNSCTCWPLHLWNELSSWLNFFDIVNHSLKKWNYSNSIIPHVVRNNSNTMTIHILPSFNI
jgi:hypothetical protein